MGPDGNISVKTWVPVGERGGFYATSAQYKWICKRALEAGLGEVVSRGISGGGLSALDVALSQYPNKANAIADIREQIEVEQRRIKDMEARRSREYRARKRQERVAAEIRTCRVCSGSMEGKRADAVACSDKCRVRFNRQQGQLRYLALDPDMSRFKR